MTMKPALLDIDQTAAFFGWSRSTTRRAWMASQIPAPIRLGNRGIRWRVADLEQFIANQTPVTPEGKTDDEN